MCSLTVWTVTPSAGAICLGASPRSRCVSTSRCRLESVSASASASRRRWPKVRWASGSAASPGGRARGCRSGRPSLGGVGSIDGEGSGSVGSIPLPVETILRLLDTARSQFNQGAKQPPPDQAARHPHGLAADATAGLHSQKERKRAFPGAVCVSLSQYPPGGACMFKHFKNLDRVLRGDATRLEELRSGRLEVSATGLALAGLVLAALYGVCMGSYGIVTGKEGGWMQIISSMIKV